MTLTPADIELIADKIAERLIAKLTPPAPAYNMTAEMEKWADAVVKREYQKRGK